MSDNGKAFKRISLNMNLSLINTKSKLFAIK